MTGQITQPPIGATQASNPGGVSIGAGGTFLRDTRGRGVRDRMNALLREDGDYMRINERKGQQYAAGRGLLNSSLAAQAGRRAAIESALPIAQADAQIQAQADAQNADASNQIALANIARDSAKNSMTVLGGGSDPEREHINRMEEMRLASELNLTEEEANRMFQREMGSADRSLTREGWGFQREGDNLDRTWRSNEAQIDRGLTREEWTVRRNEQDAQRGWQSTEAERDREFQRYSQNEQSRASMFANMMNQSLGTIFSSPDFFRDPAAASGFLEFFSGQFGSLFDRYFGPRGP